MRSRHTSLAVLVLGALLLGACADEFDPYNEVRGFRVLGLRASPPDLEPDQEAVLDALVTAQATYAWSWCPLPYGGPSRDQCPITEDELRAAVAAAGSDADLPPYDLGTDATASFTHTVPPELLESICEALRDTELPPGVSRPKCDGRFEISIRLVAGAGGESIAAVRELGLLYLPERVPNGNPTIEGGRVSVRGAPPFELEQGAPTMVVRDVEYTLELDIPDGASETYDEEVDGELMTQRENLIVTWFYEAGEMDKMRSSFIDGATTLENLAANHWRTPTVGELERNDTALYFVIRDDRGGLDWFTAELELQP